MKHKIEAQAGFAMICGWALGIFAHVNLPTILSIGFIAASLWWLLASIYRRSNIGNEARNMVERKYSLDDLDKMREAVRAKNMDSYPPIAHNCPAGGGWSKMAPESAAALDSWERSCEDQLRTCLLAGIGPEDFPPV